MRGPRPDYKSVELLDEYIRARAEDATTATAPGLGRGLARLVEASVTEGPAPDFVKRLGRDLTAGAARSTGSRSGHPWSRGWIHRVAIASVALVILLSAGAAALLAHGDRADGPQLGATRVLANAREVSTAGNVPGIDHFSMTMRSTLLATVDGQERTVASIETRRWVEQPNRWRREVEVSRYDSAGIWIHGELVYISVSDGTTEWEYENGYRLTAAGVQASGESLETKPTSSPEPVDTALSLGTLSWTTGSASVAEVLDAAMSCYDPTVGGTEVLTGRTAYVINLGPSRCQPTPYAVPAPGRAGSFVPITVWVDADTFLPLKWVGRSGEIPNMTQVFEIVELDLHPDLDPSLFTYSGPNP